jgi:hypothetical protein
MRILFTIPHYVRPHPEGSRAGRTYASLMNDTEARVRALTACLTALHQQFRPVHCFIDHSHSTASATPAALPREIDLAVCTTQGCHVLDRLPVGGRYFTHHETDADPERLGFACHEVLRQRLGRYDFYCYLEDDLVLHDPWLFAKLAWFNRHAGDDKLLLPNRFEAGLNHLVPKVYIDGPLAGHVTAPFQDVRDSPPLALEAFGATVVFERTLNPHSGCFFLSAPQMEHWCRQPHFTDHEPRFIGPLESAATLGALRTFRVYKSGPAHADFLEVQHFPTGYLSRLCPAEEGRP